MGSVHRIDNGTLVTKNGQIDDVAFCMNARIELYLRIYSQREGEERRNPAKVSRSRLYYWSTKVPFACDYYLNSWKAGWIFVDFKSPNI